MIVDRKLLQLNTDINERILGKNPAYPLYVSNNPEYIPDSILLQVELGMAGYYLTLQKDTKEWLFNLWKMTGDNDLACAVHGNTIEEVLYDAMVILVHQAKETKNV